MVSGVSNNQGGGGHAAQNAHSGSQGNSGGSDLVIWNGPRLFDPSALQQDFQNAGGSMATLLQSPQIWLLIGEGMMDTSMFDPNSAPDFASAIYYEKINAGFVGGLNQYLSGFLKNLYASDSSSDMKTLINGFCQVYPYASYGHFTNPVGGGGNSSSGGGASNTSGSKSSGNSGSRQASGATV